MSNTQIVLLGIAAAFLFWAVGAYNRLMALRNSILRRFARYEEQFALRHALLLEHLDGALQASAAPHDAAPAEQAQEWRALRAACLQAQHACTATRARPVEAGSIRSLRMAEQILQEAIGRAQQTLPSLPGMADLSRQLAICETGLQFARQQFNEAARDHDQAVRQFPTLLLARMFGFGTAGTL